MQHFKEDSMGRTSTLVVLVIAAAVIVLGAVAFTWSQKNSSTATVPAASEGAAAPAQNDATALPSVDRTADSKVVLEVRGGEFYYKPNEIKVKKGSVVTINLASDGGLHDWVLEGYDARTSRVQAGQEASVTFTADKAGTFEYYCSVGTHRQMGMKGQLIVVE